ncbi:hypothetical protein FXV83_03370 [Bradyrhizobium hipponense]|uniref:Uncharacterized protein n=1 Tax=Bradyrhizobium hipponense TaxID=2605638 RepID=A0A5S4YVR8_9BRAD|nr:hypothetical protein [Bradyrhizobium sp. CSA207]TYO67824.1 hypothetical protein FXV83_03370 [Bradyrhizobium hipponense]
MADLIVFRCPQTGMNVQTHLERQPKLEGRPFEAFSCPACTRVHFIDLALGRPMVGDR